MVTRINGSQSREVARLRSEGKTDRQIEKMMGFCSGMLARGFVVDAYDDRQVEEASRRRAEMRPYWPPAKPKVYGWRPTENCVSSRPDAKPLRSIAPTVSRHAYDD